MIRKGEKLIVWDSTVEDMYTVMAVQDEVDELRLNPLVEICGVVKYPMQRAGLFLYHVWLWQRRIGNAAKDARQIDPARIDTVSGRAAQPEEPMLSDDVFRSGKGRCYPI
jgi:hypothetical protein